MQLDESNYPPFKNYIFLIPFNLQFAFNSFMGTEFQHLHTTKTAENNHKSVITIHFKNCVEWEKKPDFDHI